MITPSRWLPPDSPTHRAAFFRYEKACSKELFIYDTIAYALYYLNRTDMTMTELHQECEFDETLFNFLNHLFNQVLAARLMPDFGLVSGRLLASCEIVRSAIRTRKETKSGDVLY